MKRRRRTAGWARTFERSMLAMTRLATATGTRALAKALKPAVARRAPPPGGGAWLPGFVVGAAGARRFRLYQPPGIGPGEKLPLMVMLHGCGQDANGFAASTRMNRLAQRERFLVLYPEQDRLSNPQGCWNWFDTASGRAAGEAELILKAIDQVCLLHPADRARVAIAGLSAGASMAALLVARHPDRFQALVMHSGMVPGKARSTTTALEAWPAHRPPLLVIHGEADFVVAPQHGRAAVQAWAGAAGARATAPRNLQRGQRYPMTVTDFKRKGHTAATLVAVARLAHAWSGGAASQPFGDARGPDASRMAWSFASRQFAPPR